MHWTDPSTALWLERIIPVVESLPVLVLVTFRPEFEWSGGIRFQRDDARPAAPRARADRADRRRSGRRDGVPPGMVERIVERSEGVPLFVEELTRASLEHGETGDAVPSTLQASLTGRLDRLGRAREVAQAAAVLGRDFDRDLLAEALPHGPRALDDALERDRGFEARGATHPRQRRVPCSSSTPWYVTPPTKVC